MHTVQIGFSKVYQCIETTLNEISSTGKACYTVNECPSSVKQRTEDEM